MLAMVSKDLGISLLPALMVRHSPYPVAVCHAPERFYRNIGIGVKDRGRCPRPRGGRGLRPSLGGENGGKMTVSAVPLDNGGRTV